LLVCRRWFGFFGKLYVLRAAYDAGLAWLAVASGRIRDRRVLPAHRLLHAGRETESWLPSPAIASAFLILLRADHGRHVVNLFGVGADLRLLPLRL
jgi:NADH-quinone oxidoreductase subunit N